MLFLEGHAACRQQQVIPCTAQTSRKRGLSPKGAPSGPPPSWTIVARDRVTSATSSPSCGVRIFTLQGGYAPGSIDCSGTPRTAAAAEWKRVGGFQKEEREGGRGGVTRAGTHSRGQWRLGWLHGWTRGASGSNPVRCGHTRHGPQGAAGEAETTKQRARHAASCTDA